MLGPSRTLLYLVGCALLVACTKTVYVNQSPSPAASFTPASASPVPSPTSISGWSAADEAQAAQELASGIKHSYSLSLRMAAGRCAVPEYEKHYPTLDDWEHGSVMAPNGHSASLATLSRDLKIIGRCETDVGI